MGRAAEPSPGRGPAGKIAEVAAWTQADVYGPTAPLGFHWGVVHETEQSLFIALCENMGGGIPMAVIRALVDAARTTGGERPNLRS